jgi:hypothetical protein
MRNGKRSALGLCLTIGAVLLSALPVAGAPLQVQRRRTQGERGARETARSLKLDRNAYRTITVNLPGPVFYAALEEINEAGLAVGNYSLDEEFLTSFSYLWHDGQMTPLPYAPDPSAWVYMYGVNDRGLVFGTIGWDTSSKAAIFDVHRGKWTLLPDVVSRGETYPNNSGTRMNDSGSAVGFACNADFSACVGWVWNGSSYSLTTLEGTTAPWTGPLAINNAGDVVGQYLDADGYVHAYLQSGSKFTGLDVPGAADTYVNDINDRGEVLLDAIFESPSGSNRNYIWSKGLLTPLPDVQGAANTYTYGLNNRGDYCGRWYDPDGASHAFLALKETGDKSK